jgi:hypothetical protein
MTFPTEWKNKIHVPKHQTDMVYGHLVNYGLWDIMGYNYIKNGIHKPKCGFMGYNCS